MFGFVIYEYVRRSIPSGYPFDILYYANSVN
jgi:hypothetical protein